MQKRKWTLNNTCTSKKIIKAQLTKPLQTTVNIFIEQRNHLFTLITRTIILN